MKNDVYHKIQEILDENSYYPENERKPRDIREKELIDWYEKYGEVNECYNLWGLDVVSAIDSNEYLDRCLFRKQRYEINSSYYPPDSKLSYNYTVFFRDKLAFEMRMQYLFGNQNCYCKSFGFIRNNTIYTHRLETGIKQVDTNDVLKHFEGKKIVLKNSFGSGGTSVIVKSVKSGKVQHENKELYLSEYLKSIDSSNTTWLLQDYVKQHSFMNCLNDSSVNTIRMISFNTGKRIVYSPSIVRCGVPGIVVDNIGLGGCIIGVNEDGTLHENMYNMLKNTKYKCSLSGQKIPYYDEAIELVARIHRYIPQVYTIGWDVVITNDGPLILEANDGWDHLSTQTPLGNHLRKIWDNLLKERKAYMQ